MLVRISLFGALGGFLFGYDQGLIGPALQAYHSEQGYELSNFQYDAIVGCAKVGAVAGTFLGGALMLYYGRQPTIAISSVFFVLGPAIMAALPFIWTLCIGRVLVGLGIGVSAVVVPAYLGEISPAKVRERGAPHCPALGYWPCPTARKIRTLHAHTLLHTHTHTHTPSHTPSHTHTHTHTHPCPQPGGEGALWAGATARVQGMRLSCWGGGGKGSLSAPRRQA